MAPSEAGSLYLGPLLGVVFDLDGTSSIARTISSRCGAKSIRIAEAHGVMPGQLSVREPVPKILEAAMSELSLGGVPEGNRFRFESEVNDSIDKIELEALPRTKARTGSGRAPSRADRARLPTRDPHPELGGLLPRGPSADGTQGVLPEPADAKLPRPGQTFSGVTAPPPPANGRADRPRGLRGGPPIRWGVRDPRPRPLSRHRPPGPTRLRPYGAAEEVGRLGHRPEPRRDRSDPRHGPGGAAAPRVGA